MPAEISESKIANTFYEEGLSFLRKKATEQLSFLSKKTDEARQKYLTKDFLYTKAKNAIKAKIFPLSAPPGWEAKMKIAKTSVAVTKKLKDKRLETLTRIKRSLDNSLSPSERTKLTNEKILAKIEYKNACAIYEKNKALVSYLETQKRAQIGGRFAGYVGMATNLVIPGSGHLVGTTLTGANTLFQEKLAETLPEDLSNKEKENVRFNTCLTVACTAASLAFSILAMPIIKQNAWYLWNSFSQL